VFRDVGIGGPIQHLVTNAQGGFTVSRTPSDTANIHVYVNGAPLAGATAASTGTLTGMPPMLILANNSSTGPAGFDPDTLGLASMGAGETAAQILADHTLFTNALSTMLIQSGC
jgi:hypothetical protein